METQLSSDVIRFGMRDCNVPTEFRSMVRKYLEEHSADELAGIWQKTTSKLNSIKYAELQHPLAYSLVHERRAVELSISVLCRLDTRNNYFWHFGMTPRDVLKLDARKRFEQLVSISDNFVPHLCEGQQCILSDYLRHMHQTLIVQRPHSRDIHAGFIRFALGGGKVLNGYPSGLSSREVAWVVLRSRVHEDEEIHCEALYQAALYALSYSMGKFETGHFALPIAAIGESGWFEVGTLSFELNDKGRLLNKPTLERHEKAPDTMPFTICWVLAQETHCAGLMRFLEGRGVCLFSHEGIYEENLEDRLTIS